MPLKRSSRRESRQAKLGCRVLIGDEIPSEFPPKSHVYRLVGIILAYRIEESLAELQERGRLPEVPSQFHVRVQSIGRSRHRILEVQIRDRRRAGKSLSEAMGDVEGQIQLVGSLILLEVMINRIARIEEKH